MLVYHTVFKLSNQSYDHVRLRLSVCLSVCLSVQFIILKLQETAHGIKGPN